VGGTAAVVVFVDFNEAIDLVVVGGGSFIVGVFAVVEISLFTVTEAWMGKELLVLRVMRM
jgi:uncharacterized membrane-anchored protein